MVTISQLSILKLTIERMRYPSQKRKCLKYRPVSFWEAIDPKR